MAGYVYVVENENHRVKIGRSTNPSKRVMSIKSQFGYNIINSYFSPVLYQYGELELFLHNVFKESRVRGEWFDISYEEVVSYLQSLDISKWNIEPTKEEKERTDNFMKGLVGGLDKCLQNCINNSQPTIAEKINEILGNVVSVSNEIDERNIVVEKYIQNLYDQIDVLQSKLIYLHEQGAQVKFPKSPRCDEDAIILAREDIIEEYNSIE